MNLKKMWKRFWTLDVHNHEGFTLVELIIVIAILAILSSVAVVGYSAYITKANKQADITLAAEVANALTLHYYNSNGAGRGWVMLTNEGVVCKSDDRGFGDAAMDAAFGDGWENNLNLKYEGWSNTIASGNMSAIAGSNFGKENLSSLLDSVNSLTNVMAEFLGAGVPIPGGLNAFAEANGIDPDTAIEQELANLMPMWIAQSLTNKMGETITMGSNQYNAQKYFEEYYVETLFEGSLVEKLQGEPLNMDKYTACSVEYAQVEGILNYLVSHTTGEEKTKADALLRQWKADTAELNKSYKGSGVQMVKGLLADTKSDILNSGISMDVLAAYVDVASQDAKAFCGYMEGLNDTSSTILSNPEGLKSDKYYAGSNVADAIVSYVEATQAIAGSDASSIILITIDSNGDLLILMNDAE